MKSILIKPNGGCFEINTDTSKDSILNFLNIGSTACIIGPEDANVDGFSAYCHGVKTISDNELLMTFIDGDDDAWDCTLDEIEETKGTLLFKPLKGSCSEFHEEVRKLQRPYIPITKEQYEALVSLPNDYYMFGDEVVTFGNADGGYALMPLQAKYATAILEVQA